MIKSLCIIALVIIGQTSSVFAGDIKKGEALVKKVCSACHGLNGISQVPLWPNLAGQHKTYLVKQLTDFKSGARKDPSMTANVKPLSKDDIENVAEYYSKQSGK